ncbi:MAG TPA: 2-phospho-L-lactate guanylyltransferase [Candidatus Binatia bacterium]|nr:2-phospho-L-lactate guanylyltransferase [Candidatus Binatia bacterium]
MDRSQTPVPRLVAIVPVGSLDSAKSRLGESLDAEERRELAVRLLERTLDATTHAPAIEETIVVTPDDEVRAIALSAGARPIRQRGGGLISGLDQARDEAIAGGAGAILVLPIDLPLLSPATIATIVEPYLAGDGDDDRPLVVLVPDRHGRGTNALLLAPADAIGFCFGGDSRAAHASNAQASGARLVELADGPLALDLDTPEDLLLVERLVPELVGAV